MASRFGPKNSTFLHYLKIMRNKYLLAPLRTDIAFQVFKMSWLKLHCFKNGRLGNNLGSKDLGS